jgi:hypothetical protein
LDLGDIALVGVRVASALPNRVLASVHPLKVFHPAHPEDYPTNLPIASASKICHEFAMIVNTVQIDRSIDVNYDLSTKTTGSPF